MIASHLVEGHMAPGEKIALRIDQTLTQDATGTMVMLEFEAMQVARVKVLNRTRNSAFDVVHGLSERQIDVLEAGGLINAVRKRQVTG